MPTLTVKAFLVTYDYHTAHTQAYLNRFAEALCTNFDNLQSQGHAKWKQVKLELPPLGKGWSYYAPMEKILRTCIARRGASANTGTVPSAPARACSQQEKVLGLCGL